jgi:hypothetical protein
LRQADRVNRPVRATSLFCGKSSQVKSVGNRGCLRRVDTSPKELSNFFTRPGRLQSIPSAKSVSLDASRYRPRADRRLENAPCEAG